MKIDSKYLPSKRFTYSALAMFTLIALALIFNFSRAKLTEYKIAEIQKKNSEEISLRQQFLQTDTDGDGMKDWEEALWKTDPKNADTDGDGTNDGDEAGANRDPLIKAPNDKIDSKIIEEEKRISDEYNKLNATEKLSRDLFSQYIATKNVSSSLSSTEIESILQTAISVEKTPTFSSYQITDLKVSSSTSKEAIKQWIEKIGEITAKNTNPSGRSEIVLLQEATETQEDTNLKELDIIVSGYKNMAQGLLEIAVPLNVSATHLKMLNSFSTIAQSVENMKSLFSDPITTIYSISTYQDAVIALYESIQDMKSIANFSGITFEQSDYGYVLINMI